MASLIFSSQGDIIRAIIISYYPTDENEVTLSLTTGNLLVFFGLWYTFTLFTPGVWIPSGVLLPGMTVGCIVGALYNNLNILVMNETSFTVAPILIGASAMLSGQLQLTYSLVVIMMETFDSFDLFIPFMISNGLASWVARLFTTGLYER